ncbi:hypothetical protein GCM10009612_62580 [Streptomyces beijiangensis]
MRIPPEGKVFELWYSDHGTMRPAGLLDAARAAQSVLMSGPVGRADGVGVTLERAGGAKTPTLPPVGVVDFD